MITGPLNAQISINISYGFLYGFQFTLSTLFTTPPLMQHYSLFEDYSFNSNDDIIRTYF